LELYKQHGVNPAAGCLPQIVQLVVLIALYQAFIGVLGDKGSVDNLNQLLYPSLKLAEGTILNTHFLYLDLAKPDIFHLPQVSFPLPGLFLILAALVQFLSAKMMAPVVARQSVAAVKTENKSDDMAAMMQTYSIYLFPLMTLWIGFSFRQAWCCIGLFFPLSDTSTILVKEKLMDKIALIKKQTEDLLSHFGCFATVVVGGTRRRFELKSRRKSQAS
jgi:membrane protein insertase Oxa1/YidC/SpoIIIJ